MRIERRIGQRRTVPALPGIIWGDLLYVLAGTIVLLALLALGEQATYLRPLRIVLGTAYVLFVPGYCLTMALLPRADDLDLAERVGISFGLSIALVPLLAVLLDRLPWGFQLWPIVWAELSVIGGAMLVAIGRRISLARVVTDLALPHQGSEVSVLVHKQPSCSAMGGPGRAKPSPKPLPLGPTGQVGKAVKRHRSFEQRAYLFIAAVLVSAALYAAWVVLVPSPDSYMTEFYTLGKGGLAEDLPGRAAPDEELGVTIGIVNRERAPQRYHVEVWVSDTWDRGKRTLVQQVGPYALAVGEGGRWPLSWRMPWMGSDQQVELLLFVEQQPEPYRRLLLWVDVAEGRGAKG